MGQQQLLLIVLGVIIVGIAVISGIAMFRSNAIEQKRDSVMMDCILLASMAQQYFLKPSESAGGGMSYENWVIPTELETNENGHYKITAQTATSLTILGTGNEVTTADDSVKVQVVIPNPPANFQVSVVN